ncbi:ABC transporter permease subunit [Ruania suaedae]|uniref:ABC transporter permease n=1 Tax=Ruania suaedae TaxID=2897774 RepID=UPI001E3315AE|nr:ABC transporter permease subunit [Ruania suaedae]UFU02992.1 ABC transporter permease subunit [Ruania suaedae]
MSFLPRIPIGEAAEGAVDWIKANLPWLLDAIQEGFGWMAESLTELLLVPPALVMTALFLLLAAWFRSIQFAVFVLISMLLVISMELWEPAMQTLSMVLVATLVATVIAIPVGILAAKNDTVSAVVRPILDFMQTMPALAYLVPVVLFFSIGYPPGVVATIIFAMAPGVRLTELGIRQVDHETVEAGEAFGGTSRQILRGIQLPLGLPTIMAGVNQVIMLGLSMAVLAGLVGAPGLGKVVASALSTVDVATGAEAGLAIVFLAIFLDRLTGAIGQPTGGSISALVRKRRKAAAQNAQAEAGHEPATAGAH